MDPELSDEEVFSAMKKNFEEPLLEVMLYGKSVRKYTFSEDGGLRVGNIRDITER